MSWSKALPRLRPRIARRLSTATILAGALLLSGCGFHPLYAERSDPQLSEQLATVSVAPAPDHLGQVLTNMLNDSFRSRGESVTPKYQLETVPIVMNYDKGTRLTGTASRTDQVLILSYRLVRLADNTPVLTRAVTSRTGFDQNDNQYANVVVKQDNQMRQVRDLALQVEMSVAAYLGQVQAPAKP